MLNTSAFFKSVPTFLVGMKSDMTGRFESAFEDNFEKHLDGDENGNFGEWFDPNIDGQDQLRDELLALLSPRSRSHLTRDSDYGRTTHVHACPLS